MGAYMLTAHITTTKTDPERLNWDAAHAALSAITDPDAFEFGDPESEVDALLGPDDDRDVLTADGALDIEVLRDAGTAALKNLREALDSRKVDILTLGGYTAFVSGGMSYGDAPTDAADAIWMAHRLPVAVLHAAGLAIDVFDELADRKPSAKLEVAALVSAVVEVPADLVPEHLSHKLDSWPAELLTQCFSRWSLATGIPISVLERALPEGGVQISDRREG